MEVSMSKNHESLPDRANLDQLRKQAKELHATAEFASLASAQHALAHRYGFESWPQLKLAVESHALRRLKRERDVDGVAQLLQSSPKVASHTFPDGGTPLHEAAEFNCADVLPNLVAAGAKFEKTYGGSGHTALSWAITVGSMKAALKLVELGNEPDLFCASGLGLLPKVEAFWHEGKLRSHPSTTGSSRYDDSGSRLPCPPERTEDQVSDALYIASRCGQI